MDLGGYQTPQVQDNTLVYYKTEHFNMLHFKGRLFALQTNIRQG